MLSHTPLYDLHYDREYIGRNARRDILIVGKGMGG